MPSPFIGRLPALARGEPGVGAVARRNSRPRRMSMPARREGLPEPSLDLVQGIFRMRRVLMYAARCLASRSERIWRCFEKLLLAWRWPRRPHSHSQARPRRRSRTASSPRAFCRARSRRSKRRSSFTGVRTIAGTTAGMGPVGIGADTALAWASAGAEATGGTAGAAVTATVAVTATAAVTATVAVTTTAATTAVTPIAGPTMAVITADIMAESTSAKPPLASRAARLSGGAREDGRRAAGQDFAGVRPIPSSRRPPAHKARAGDPCRAWRARRAVGSSRREGARRGGRARLRHQHAIVCGAAGLLDTLGGVHRVANEGDLFLERAEFADGDRAAVKAGAEVGALAERALVSRALLAEPVEGGKAGAYASGLVHPWSEPPGRDDLIADVFVNFAAGFGDGERHVGDEAVEEVEKGELTEARGDCGRRAHVNE